MTNISPSSELFLAVGISLVFAQHAWGFDEGPFLFTHPVITHAESVVVKEIVGTYFVRDTGSCIGDLIPFEQDSTPYWHVAAIGPEAKGLMEIVIVDMPNSELGEIQIERFIFFARKTNDKYVIQIPIKDELPVSSFENWKAGDFDGYQLARMSLVGKELKIDLLDYEKVTKLIEKNRLQRDMNKQFDEYIWISSNTIQLKQQMLDPAIEVFAKDSILLNRVQIDH